MTKLEKIQSWLDCALEFLKTSLENYPVKKDDDAKRELNSCINYLCRIVNFAIKAGYKVKLISSESNVTFETPVEIVTGLDTITGFGLIENENPWTIFALTTIEKIEVLER